MKVVTVKTSTEYAVHIGSGLLKKVPGLLREPCRGQKLCIVSDSNVWPRYGTDLEADLAENGYEVIRFVFPAGEESKNGETYLHLLNFLAENRMTRADCLIALGGGVVGDLTGFAAATYLRGIDFIQIPTTLLAAVDSSVGGKTAIDLPAGKNLCGAFYQPKLVVCDIDTLNSLPDEIFRDGCAEVIKYGVLYDERLFAHLLEHGSAFCREETIAQCIELKRDVVMADEFDRGQRQKLNLGHTIGHSVEALSHFTLSHGKAVAIGMAIITRAAAKMSLCEPSACALVLQILDKFGLPSGTDQSADALFAGALSDKKRSGGTVNLIVPRQIGDCMILPVPVEKLQSIIEAGL